jgi:hypothetical protein
MKNSTNISQAAFVLLQDIQGFCRTLVTHAPDNAENGGMRPAQRVKIFQTFLFSIKGTTGPPCFYAK